MIYNNIQLPFFIFKKFFQPFVKELFVKDLFVKDMMQKLPF